MSRKAKYPVKIADGVTVTATGETLSVKGPLGEVSRPLHALVTVQVADGSVKVDAKNTTKLSRALAGTTAAHIKNMIKGVKEKYVKKLELQGIGYRVEMQGKNLKLLVGFSHPVIVPVPAGVEVSVEKNVITISGIDKEVVGQFAANVRAVKKPEPYKGKGLRYEGEYVRQKQGKKAAA